MAKYSTRSLKLALSSKAGDASTTRAGHTALGYRPPAPVASRSPRGRLRSPNRLCRPRWRSSQSCTNIQTGPRVGGRSGGQAPLASLFDSDMPSLRFEGVALPFAWKRLASGVGAFSARATLSSNMAPLLTAKAAPVTGRERSRSRRVVMTTLQQEISTVSAAFES